MVKVLVPVLVRLALLGALVVPVACCPKFSGVRRSEKW